MAEQAFPMSNQTRPYWADGIGWSNPNGFAWHAADRSE